MHPSSLLDALLAVCYRKQSIYRRHMHDVRALDNVVEKMQLGKWLA
jgi:hypothetical protein